jgi:hypothetical protein
MLNLFAKASPKTASRIVRATAKMAEKLGATVRKDKDSTRYFIHSGEDHYILAARSMRKRDAETIDGDTYRASHAGYLSLYKEHAKPTRHMWDLQQRDLGE